MRNNDKLRCESLARAALGEPAKREGAELLYRCPHPEGHKNGDAHPSMKVNPKKDVWLCGPCGAKGEAWALAAFIAGVDASDKARVMTWLKGKGLLDGAKRKAKADGRGPVVASYVYMDAQGNPVCRKLRHEPGVGGKPKDYTWERFEGSEWKSGLGDPPIIPPLYRLREIKDQPLVFLFESNPDVDLACSMELAATTSGGCNSWHPEYAEVFRGKCVCVVPDNDGPGAGYAATVCASLYEKVDSLKVVSVAPERDFTRWIQAGGTAECALRYVGASPRLAPRERHPQE